MHRDLAAALKCLTYQQQNDSNGNLKEFEEHLDTYVSWLYIIHPSIYSSDASTPSPGTPLKGLFGLPRRGKKSLQK